MLLRKNNKGFSHHFLLPLIAVLAVGAIGYYMLHLSNAATPETGGTTFKLFAPAWRDLGGPANEVNVQYFKEIFGSQNPQAIHEKYPNTKVYKYTLGPYVTQAYVRCDLIPNANTWKDLITCGTKALDDSAIAKGISSGLSVYANGFPNNFLLVPDSASSKAYLTANAAEVVKYDESATNLYDGVLTDSMGVAPVSSNYLNEKPKNPATGVQYTKTQWLAAQAQMMNAKSDGLAPSGKVLIMNGLANGKEYFTANPDESARKLLTDKVAGGMAERIFREPNYSSTDWRRPESEWLKDVKMIQDVQAMGKKGYWWTKCWSTRAYVDTVGTTKQYTDSCKYETGDVDTRIRQVMRFALASYLLGAGDKSYFNFDADKYEGAGKSNAAEFYPAYKNAFKLGLAKDANFTKTGKVYSRNFKNGIAVVNPTNASATFNLGTLKLRDLDGRRLSGVIAIPAHTGNILVGAVGI